MSITNKSLACLVLAIALSSCDEGKGPGNPDAYQGKDGVNGNECSQQFVSDYNEVARTARYVSADLQLSNTATNRAQAKSDAQSLKDKATALKSKYAGVNCTAVINGSKEQIDVNQNMATAIAAADEVLSAPSQTPSGPSSGTGTGTVTSTRVNPPAATGNERCNVSFLNEMLAITDYAKAIGDDLELVDTPANRVKTKADAETLKREAKAFQARHPGYKCDAVSETARFTIDVDAKTKDYLKLADGVIDLINRGASAAPAAALLAPQVSVVPIQVINN